MRSTLSTSERLVRFAFAWIGALVLFTSAVSGQTIVYWDTNGSTAGTGTTGGTWDPSTTSAWTTNSGGTGTVTTWNSVASGGKLATFSAGTNGNTTFTVTTSGAISNVGGINFQEGNITIASGGTLALSQNATFTAGSGATGTINAPLSGAFGITKSGTGTIVFGNVSSSFTGSTTISQGSLVLTANTPIGAPGALGNSSTAIVMNDANTGGNATSLLIGASGVTVGRAITVANSGTGTTTIGTNLTSGNASFGSNITLNKSASLNADGTSNATFSGVISGTGGITKTGTGNVTLSGANTFSGAATVGSANGSNAGTLVIGTATALPANASVNVFGGNLTLSGNASLSSLNLGGGAAGSTAVIGGTGTITLNGNVTYDGSTGANGATISNGVAVGSVNRTFNIGDSSAATNDLTLSGAVTGTAGIVKTGSGNLLLSNTSNAYGNTTIGTAGGASGGTLTLGASNVLPGTTGSSVTIYGGTLAMGANSDTIGALNLGGGQSGTSASITGNGTLTLGGNVTYDATNNPNGATIAANLALGTANRTFNIGSSTGSGGSDLAVSGVVSGTTGVVKTGNGTLAFSASNSYSGATTIQGGTLSIAQLGGLGSSSTNSANLVLNGGTLQYTGTGGNTTRTFTLGANGGTLDASGSGVLRFNSTGTPLGYGSTSGARTLTLTGSNTGNNEFDLILGDYGTGSSTSLVKTGNGTWMLNGTKSNTYTGDTYVNSGTLVLSAKTSTNATGTGDMWVGDGVNSATVMYDPTGAANQLGNGAAIIINGRGTFNMNNQSDQFGTLSDGSNVTNGYGNFTYGTATVTIGQDNGNGVGTKFSGIFSGSITGSGRITKNGTGIQGLAGDNANFTGGLTLSAGSLYINSAGALGTGSLTIGSGTTIDNTSGNAVVSKYNNAQTWSGSFTYGGTNDLNLGNGTVTMNSATTITTNQSGTLTVGGSVTGSGSLTKAGNSTLVLGGNNTFTSTTTVSAGTLQIGAGGTSGTFGTGSVTDNGNIVFNRTDAFTVSNNISGSGTVTQAGSGSVTLSGTNSYTGNTTVSSGTLIVGSTTALGNVSSGTSIASGATLGFQGNISYTNHENITAIGTGAAGRAGAVDNISGTNSFAGNIAIAGNTTIGATAGALTLSGGIGQDGSATGETLLTLSPAANASITLSGAIDDTAAVYPISLAHVGNGTVTLSNGANNYYGNTTIGQSGIVSTGMLKMGANNALPTSNNNSVIQIYSGTLDLNGFNATAAGNIVLGGGGSTGTATINTGTGTLTLNHDIIFDATNNMSGTTINGNLALSGSVGGDTHVIRVNDASTGADLTINSVISATTGIAEIDKYGNGTLVLTNANTYTGVTAIREGVVKVQNAQALGNTSLGTNVNSGATLQLSGGLNMASEGLTLSGLGYNSSGALQNVSGNNTWNGTVTLATTDARVQSDAGMLTIAGNVSATGNGSLQVGGNSTVKVTGAIVSSVTGSISNGNTAISKQDAGTLILAGNDSFKGAVKVQGGTLSVQNNTALGTQAVQTNNVTVSSGATLAFDSTANGNLVTQAANVTISGVGVGSNGAIQNTAGTNTFNGPVTLAADSTITANSATALTISGNVASTGTTTLTVGGSTGAGTNGSVTLSGPIVNTSGTLNLTKVGSVNGTDGRLTISGGGTVGTVNLNGGSLTVSSATLTTGNFTTSTNTSLLVASGGTLNINGTGTIAANTLDTSSAGIIQMNGANSLYLGANTASGLTLSVGSTSLAGPTVVYLLGNVTIGTLQITGNTILDFGNSTVTSLTSGVLNITNGNATIQVRNWATTSTLAASDLWKVTGTINGQALGNGTLDTAAPLTQVTWNNPVGSIGNTTTWVGDTSQGWYDHEIRPTPEPATYGAIFISACLGFVGWYRFRGRKRRV